MRRIIVFILAFSCWFNIGFSQGEGAISYDLSTPHGTVYTHLFYLQSETYRPDIAAKVFYKPTDSIAARKLAIKLIQIYDGQGLFVQMNSIPQNPDYVDTVSRSAYFTPFKSELPEIFLEKIDDKWYYSEETARAIPRIHKKIYPFGTDFLLNLFPKEGQRKYLGLAVWQWTGIGLLILLVFMFQYILSRLIRPIISRLGRTKYSLPLEDNKAVSKIAKYLSLWILFSLLNLFIPILQLPIETSEIVFAGLRIFKTIILMLLAIKIFDIVIIYATRYSLETEHKMDEQLMPILKRIGQAVIIIAAIIHILQLIQVNVTALIAGVSIGGLALALAAQDTVKNLIGSLMIFVDRPFQIGDWIEYGGTAGTVVEVGFRSTRIQLTDSSIVSVPNGQISSGAITNKGVRTFRLMMINLGVTYDTPPALMEVFIEGLKEIIEMHPDTVKENYYVHFNSFGDSSLNILFRVNVLVQDYRGDLLTKEELSFAILKLANSIGVRFAFPSTTMYVEEFPKYGNTAPEYELDRDILKQRSDDILQEVKASFKTKTILD